ncbi:metal-sensing transcriptional repressor [Prauserella muralis]|uniref:Uncharacterized protein n=1 Tax=Prauserella muralis TaxID=588067 RepID=A0A2V4B294_9PSEU|nr:metal-sensing transcriptional repressor [Prauserella muralis]PXY28266.1 hypothetical protein BAY60_18300 [Prauserella muralis]TWE27441.1 DNA-binding FrmR family transcriptional regulator [Prauserella muralis]
METDLHVAMLPAGMAALVRRRLRRAAGQVAGIERMLADGRSCEQMLVQLAAVHGALRAVEQQLLVCHVTATTASVAAGVLSPDEAAEQTAFLSGLLAHTSAARPTKNSAQKR